MARVILDGFRNYEEALAFAEWFGYNGVEVDTADSNYLVEGVMTSARVETGDVEVDTISHTISYRDSDLATDFNCFDDEEI